MKTERSASRMSRRTALQLSGAAIARRMRGAGFQRGFSAFTGGLLLAAAALITSRG